MGGDLRTNRNEMLTEIANFWKLAPGIVGLPGTYPEIVIRDTDSDNNPDDVIPTATSKSLPFLRVTVQHTQSSSRAISGRRYRNNGVVTVNLFVPRIRTDANRRCIDLASALTAALKKHRGNVYFVNVTPRERPINNGFSQVDVVSDFFWDQFGA